jgi:long-chain acyl-CoA synthetase
MPEQETRTTQAERPADASFAAEAPGAPSATAMTLEDACNRALARDPAQQAIEFEGRWYTWGDLRQVADRLRAAIRDSGSGGPTVVAFAPRNQPSAIAAFLGLLAGGHLIRMVYAFQSPAGIARDIEKCEATVAVFAAQDASDELIATLRDHGIAGIALTDVSAEPLAGLERTSLRADPGELEPKRIEILTSGTTGPPKRFAVKYSMIANSFLGSSLMAASASTSDERPPILLFMPLGNISGIYTTVPAMLIGSRVTLLERFTVAGWHDHLVRYRPEHSGVPPSAVQMLLDQNVPVEDLACVKSFGIGAAPLDPTVQRAFEERYNIPILLSYGATEFGGPVTAMTRELHAEFGGRKFGSVGRPFGGAKLRVIDPETEEVLPPGREGILEVVSPRIGPEWIRTSDVAMIDEDGFLFHRGRADGAIMRGGFKILPETIERALLLHRAVSAASVVALPDRRVGQVPGAVIKFKPEAGKPSIQELEAHLRQHVYATHIPTRWRFVDQLPLTPSMKISKPGVRALFDDGED